MIGWDIIIVWVLNRYKHCSDWMEHEPISINDRKVARSFRKQCNVHSFNVVWALLPKLFAFRLRNLRATLCHLSLRMFCRFCKMRTKQYDYKCMNYALMQKRSYTIKCWELSYVNALRTSQICQAMPTHAMRYTAKCFLIHWSIGSPS